MDYTRRIEQTKKIKDLAYYIVVGLISLISVVFLPMIGSSGKFTWPQTWTDWVVWGTSRLAISIVNILLFYCFMSQAKVNVKDNPEFIRANGIYKIIKQREDVLPRSPEKFIRGQWLGKGIALFLTSAVSVVALTEAILSFDLTQFLAYIFTIIMGIVFGYLTMRSNEDYWITEFPVYVDYVYAKTLKESATETQQTGIQTATESNVSESTEELSKEEIKEAENA